MKKLLGIVVLGLSFAFINQNVSWSKSCGEIKANAKNNWCRIGCPCMSNATGAAKKLELKCAKKAAGKKTDIDAKKTWNKCYY